MRRHAPHFALLLILVGAVAVRLPGLTLPFGFINEWGQSLFLVVARNYQELGLVYHSVPIFSLTENSPVVYANHPWLASLLLGGWCAVFGVSEASFRSLALTVSLGTVATTYGLGSRLCNPKCGLLAAFLFAFSPLSIHLGRVYGMEEVNLLFLLLFLFHADRWRESGRRRDLVLAGLSLSLGQAADVYGLLFTPLLLPAALTAWRKRNPKWRGILVLAAIPLLVSLLTVSLLSLSGLASDSVAGGIGRGTRGWALWFQPGFWIDSLGKLRGGYTLLLPCLAVASLLWKKTRPNSLLWAALWLLPVLHILVAAPWHRDHNYFIQYFGPVLCLASANLLVSLGTRRSGVALTALALCLFVALSWRSVEGWRAHYDPHDAELGLEIRKHTSDRDLLVGLPPVMAYYIDRPFQVPYFYFIRSDYNGEPARFYRRVAELCRDTSYERVIMFKKFLVPPWVDIDQLDHDRALDGLEEFELTSPPGQDPAIWSRRS